MRNPWSLPNLEHLFEYNPGHYTFWKGGGMEELITNLENAYFMNVLNVLEQLLLEVPRPAYELKEGKTSTRYYLTDLVRRDSQDEKSGRISMNYYKSAFTQYGAMVGMRPEKEPLIFQCFQRDETDAVEIKGYYSTETESRDWIKQIFEDIWRKLLVRFST